MRARKEIVEEIVELMHPLRVKKQEAIKRTNEFIDIAEICSCAENSKYPWSPGLRRQCTRIQKTAMRLRSLLEGFGESFPHVAHDYFYATDFLKDFCSGTISFLEMIKRDLDPSNPRAKRLYRAIGDLQREVSIRDLDDEMVNRIRRDRLDRLSRYARPERIFLRQLGRVAGHARNISFSKWKQVSIQNECARWAYSLIEGISTVPISGSDTNPYRMISPLFFEALTGKADVDLKDRC
jgi:hypothetical protein